MKEIKLTQGKFALIDDEDYEKVSQYKWCANKAGNTFYAITETSNKKRFYLHRLILNVIDKKIKIDHIDHNGLNCTRQNMRECTHAENMANGKLRTNNTSGRKGVYKSCKLIRNPFVARIMKDGRQISLGCYPTPEAAGRAYDEAAKKHFGEFAKTNF